MTPLEVGEVAAVVGSPVPPPPLPPTTPRLTVPSKVEGNADSSKLLLEDIRNGIVLKPTKTVDKSTPAFIKKSNGANVEQLQMSPADCSKEEECTAIDDMKDALQEELRNTLKRKVKKQDIERGDPSKNHEIEKAMEQNRTEVELKVNTSISAKPPRAINDSGPASTEPKVTVKPFKSTSPPSLNGTLRTVSPQKELKIDISVAHSDNIKHSILSPEVRNGNAAIRPSQIRTLTKQGSHVSHTDIVQDANPVHKSPISLVDSPDKTVFVSPPPSITRSLEPTRSGQSSPRSTYPTRTTILDTRSGSANIKPPMPSPTTKVNSADPPKRLLISHPKASFTLPRTKSQQQQSKATSEANGETKPVFRILTQLEQSEQQQEHATKIEVSRTEPTAARPYLSFARELANSANKYPDTVLKTTTVGTVKEDLFFENTNLRDIKIDIVENGQLRVTNK